MLRSKGLTTLQRRSIQRIRSVLILTLVTNFASPGVSNPLFELFPSLAQFMFRQRVSAVYAGSLSLLSLLPILFAVWTAAHYLRSELDEFVRTLVTRALLWGFAMTMAGDAVLGVLTTVYGRPFPISLLNADVFVASTIIAFRLLRRSYE